MLKFNAYLFLCLRFCSPCSVFGYICMYAQATLQTAKKKISAKNKNQTGPGAGPIV